MNWIIDKATVNCVWMMDWFGIFQVLVLYSKTVKWDWSELAQGWATVKCVGKIHWFGMFQNQ